MDLFFHMSAFSLSGYVFPWYNYKIHTAISRLQVSGKIINSYFLVFVSWVPACFGDWICSRRAQFCAPLHEYLNRTDHVSFRYLWQIPIMNITEHASFRYLWSFPRMNITNHASLNKSTKAVKSVHTKLRILAIMESCCSSTTQEEFIEIMKV